MPADPLGPAPTESGMVREFAALRDANEQLILSALRAQVEMEHAEHDPLTGLAMRSLLQDRFTKAAASAKRHGTRLAVMFVDLNNFKQVNDSLGHTVGDGVLQRAADCLLTSVRDTDTVSRYGGDEFVLVLTDIGAPSDARRIADTVCDALAVPSRVGDHVIRLTASIGISFYPDDGIDATVLIDKADVAMYRAKRRGACSYAFFDDAVLTHADTPAAELTALMHPVAYLPLTLAEHERRNSALREANEQLVLAALIAQGLQAESEARQLQQTEFMAVLAHELRNPLVPMRNVASVLSRVTPDDSALHKMQGIIERQVAHMARLVDDLLDVSRASTGKLRLNVAQVDMTSVVADTIDACRPAIDLRLQRLVVSVPATATFVPGDAVRLTQVVTNLVDNASRYTPDGGAVSVILAMLGEQVTVTVTDSGIGISATALPRVFELFTQDLHAVGFNNVGLGIGLKVVHELVTAHHGTVEVHSDGLGKGSTFIVTLPGVPTQVAD
jgi:diguanylate cyclase (GGDEF)-like protein